MEEKITVSAKTLDEAITKVLIELQTTSDHLDYEVVQKESSGLLGLFAKPCVIRARVMSEAEEQTLKEEKAKAIKAAQIAEEEAQKAKEAREAQQRELKAKVQTERQIAKPAESEKKESVEVTAEPENSEKPEQAESEKKTKASAKIDEVAVKTAAKNFLSQVFDAMEMEVSVEAEYDPSERELRVMMEGGDMGILIGKRGQTLDSLQYLVSLVVNRETEGYLRVKLDTENYRERRKETLETLAKNISYKVKRTKHPVALEPMNPYERRIIHSALQNDRYVVTRSEGEDPYRHVVISLKKEVPYSGNATRKDRYPSRRDKNGAEMADGKKGGKKPYRSRNRSAQNHVPGAKNAQDAQSLSVRSEKIGEQVVSTEEVVLVKTETTVVETITTGSETTES